MNQILGQNLEPHKTDTESINCYLDTSIYYTKIRVSIMLMAKNNILSAVLAILHYYANQSQCTKTYLIEIGRTDRRK